MQSFRDLTVRQTGHQLTPAMYGATRAFPGSELYGLTSQMRRASASIGADIAEGCGRDAGPDFARSVQMAMGSASESEYHVLPARDLNLLSNEVHQRLADDTTGVKRMLTSLIRKVGDTKTAHK